MQQSKKDLSANQMYLERGRTVDKQVRATKRRTVRLESSHIAGKHEQYSINCPMCKAPAKQINKPILREKPIPQVAAVDFLVKASVVFLENIIRTWDSSRETGS